MSTHSEWIVERERAVWAPHGIAALAATYWLDGTPRSFDDVPGRWHTEADAVLGELDGASVRLAPGDGIERDELELRGFARDGAVALRVFDPAAPRRRGLSRIDRWEPDDRFLVQGRVLAASRSGVPTVAVDGHRSHADYDVVLELELPDGAVQLCTQTREDGTLFAAFSDATSGAESYRFRFLRLPAPAPDGTVTVDLNRAFLPPCAFSDHYVCVFPPPTNRWSIPVRAGEKLVH